jgi:hypothetical protein
LAFTVQASPTPCSARPQIVSGNEVSSVIAASLAQIALRATNPTHKKCLRALKSGDIFNILSIPARRCHGSQS